MGTSMRRRAASAALSLLALGTLAIAGLAVAWDRAMAPYGVAGAEIRVKVPPGTSVRGAGDLLAREGVLRDPRLLPLLVRLEGGVVKAGDYLFRPPLSPRQVLEQLAKGGEPPPFLRVTVAEGLRIDQVAELVQGYGLGSCESVLALLRDPSLIRDLDPHAGDLEGYLFPDTYHLELDATAADVVRAMVARFREVASSESARRAPELPLRMWVTLASLVEEETPLPEERPLVASVYWNRLRKGMLLQCDPTIVYARSISGLPPRELLLDDLGYDHPYNTYRHPGLPPGPISSPGLASLRAALAPEESDLLYFVATGSGGHRFSRTMGEHSVAVGEYRRQRAAQRRAQRVHEQRRGKER